MDAHDQGRQARADRGLVQQVHDRATTPMLQLLQTSKEAPTAVILTRKTPSTPISSVKLTLEKVRFVQFS